MISREVKQCIGQMIHGVHVVGAAHAGVQRAYTSHWVTQVSFDAPVLMVSISPKHDTYPLLVAAEEFAVSVLAADQVAEAQYFGYPGRKFAHVASEYVQPWPERPDGPPVVPNSIAWLRCDVFEQVAMRDHELVFAEVADVVALRLKTPPLLYSSRLGWRATGGRAREPEMAVRDGLLTRLTESRVEPEH